MVKAVLGLISENKFDFNTMSQAVLGLGAEN